MDARIDRPATAAAFKTAKELKISKAEQRALIALLGMLERGEIVECAPANAFSFYDDRFGLPKGAKKGLDMDVEYQRTRGCGTVACLGGWVAQLTKQNAHDYLQTYNPLLGNAGKLSHELGKLYWEYPRRNDVTVMEAAAVLRRYLVSGKVVWDD